MLHGIAYAEIEHECPQGKRDLIAAYRESFGSVARMWCPEAGAASLPSRTEHKSKLSYAIKQKEAQVSFD